ncbi:MAG TPA: pantoate--beta-alanine ligase [Rhodothermales bacterium]|nr:pantoate--beta-alanine ligase [Rhodothermales bacterium]
MQLIHTVRAMQALADERRAAGQTLALVPTMGALHEGHLALVDEARKHADHITVSIFVNPTQFGPGEDFDRYPRQLEADRKALERRGGVDEVFVPVLEEMYPDGQDAQQTWVDVEQMDKHLCGRQRPGHFRGVTTVVSKLFNCCRPHIAVFGRKDAQQFIILKRMSRDLNFGIELIGIPIVREADGLALSSRNVYLSPDERQQAVVLSQAVEAVRARILEGEQQAAALVETMRQTIGQAPDARIQYTEVVDVTTLQPIEVLEPGQEVLAAVAVFFGATRLIDNVFVRVPQPD